MSTVKTSRLSELEKKVQETEERLKKYKQEIFKYRKSEAEKKRKLRTRTLIEIGAIIAGDKHLELLDLLKNDKEYALNAHKAFMKRIESLAKKNEEKNKIAEE